MKTTIPNMAPTNLDEHLPRYYDEIRETDALMQVENELFDEIKNELTFILSNQFILTCDVQTLALWEQLLGIHFDPTVDNDEGYQFRRDRLINRLVQRPPFTYWFLRERLDAIVGRENYTLAIDYNAYHLTLESAIDNQATYNEMILTVYRLKPANMIFRLVPFLQDWVHIEACAYISQLTYKRVGTWILGQTPFEQLGLPKRADEWIVGTTRILNFDYAEEVPLR